MAHCDKLKTKMGCSPSQSWIVENIQYEAITGSFAYGMNSDMSDIDLVAVTVPPKEIIFPFENRIYGFDNNFGKFEVYQKHHIPTEKSEYDVTVYNIVKFFQLAMDCNPNIIDVLFVPDRCVTKATSIGQYIRLNRKLFLSKKAFHTFTGYAYSQKSKIRTIEDIRNAQGQDITTKRRDSIEQYGYDTKFASHTVRLINQCEQMFTEGDLDLERSKEVLKSIRRGEWKLSEIHDYFKSKEASLQQLYHQTTSPIPHKPDVDRIRAVLYECLEMWFGNVSTAISTPHEGLLRDLKGLVARYE